MKDQELIITQYPLHSVKLLMHALVCLSVSQSVCLSVCPRYVYMTKVRSTWMLTWILIGLCKNDTWYMISLFLWIHYSNQFSIFLYFQKVFRFFSRKHNPQTALLVRYAICFFLGGLVGLIPYLVFVIQLCKGLSTYFNFFIWLLLVFFQACVFVVLSVDQSIWLTEWLMLCLSDLLTDWLVCFPAFLASLSVHLSVD